MDFKIPDTPEELLRQGRRNIHQIERWLPTLVTLVVLLGIALSSFYSIGTDEVGVIRRFGKYDRTTNPGLHWKLPLGIEQLNKVKVTHEFKEEFGFRTEQAGIRTRYAEGNFEAESLMLTGDLNVLDVTWVIQFRISNPSNLLFNIRDPRQTVRDVSESVMRQVIGDSSATGALTTSRIEINLAVKDKMQAILDRYQAGIAIKTVELQDVNAPDPVKPSFNEVNEAKQEKEKVINQAWEKYNQAIPRARGEAERTIREAEGYALSRVNEAKGDAARFLATWTAYREAKDVTRRRLYLETMAEVLPKAGRKIIAEPGGQSVIPLLHLDGGKTP